MRRSLYGPRGESLSRVARTATRVEGWEAGHAGEPRDLRRLPGPPKTSQREGKMQVYTFTSQATSDETQAAIDAEDGKLTLTPRRWNATSWI